MGSPASSASRSTASGKERPSVSITNLKMSPFWPEEKSNQEPLWSLTKKEGVFSCLKGESPFISRPARLSDTLRATTWLTGSRARISSRSEGGKRMGPVSPRSNHRGLDTQSLCDSLKIPFSDAAAVAHATNFHRVSAYFSSSFTSPLALPKSIWPA